MMKQNRIVKGTQGYNKLTQAFVNATLAIDFQDLHQDFLAFLPKSSAQILDLGAGIGRDASVFANMGHAVVAVEPSSEFRLAGQKLFPSTQITWLNDSLPSLVSLDKEENTFDFILASAVWHHLNAIEQSAAIRRVSGLLKHKGIFALSLRHGPAGAGTHVFPVDGNRITKEAKKCSLKTLLYIENQPSLMANKERVSWTRLVFSKK